MRCSECNAEMKYDQPDGLCDSCADVDEIGRLKASLVEEKRNGDESYAKMMQERNAARGMLLRIVGHEPSHVCAWCGMPATCFGGDAGSSVAFACDTCCGHGNEDSWCVPVEELGKVLR